MNAAIKKGMDFLHKGARVHYIKSNIIYYSTTSIQKAIGVGINARVRQIKKAVERDYVENMEKRNPAEIKIIIDSCEYDETQMKIEE